MKSPREIAEDLTPDLPSFHNAHYIDLVIRDAGIYKHYEADWLKKLRQKIEAAIKNERSLKNESTHANQCKTGRKVR